MIEFKINSHISNCVKTNQLIKVHLNDLSSYVKEQISSSNFPQLFVTTLPSGFTLFSSCFLCSRLTEGFSAIYLVINIPYQLKQYIQKPSKCIYINYKL